MIALQTIQGTEGRQQQIRRIQDVQVVRAGTQRGRGEGKRRSSARVAVHARRIVVIQLDARGGKNVLNLGMRASRVHARCEETLDRVGFCRARKCAMSGSEFHGPTTAGTYQDRTQKQTRRRVASGCPGTWAWRCRPVAEMHARE